MRKVLLLASVALALLLASGVAMIEAVEPAEAAFPGTNGKIASVSTRDGDEEIYVVDADGTNETRLTTDPGRDIHPRLSPDGKRVTFTRRPLIGGVSEETIYVMDPEDVAPADGSGDNLVKLTPAPSPNFQSAYSPDGTQLVFVRQEPPGSDNEIWVMNADGTKPVQLTHNDALDSRPVFSPDGTKIAYQRLDPGSDDRSRRQLDVYIMNADGTQQTRLTTTPQVDSNPSFSPDGETIAFDSTRIGAADIYVMNTDGTDQTRLTFDPSTEIFPAFSPDGNHLAFSSDRDGNPEIYVTNADASAAPIPLTETDPPAENARLDWGPLLYDFAGFLKPVDNLPITNEVKAGRAVPVKFSLGGDQGFDVFAAGYPKSQQIDCDSAMPVDTLEQTATAGESGLSYEAATGEYSYVWKTEKSWAGTCRQLAVKLDDGTVHRASFTFK
jgi:Tol biopolymer transport system component